MARNWTDERKTTFTQNLIEALPYMQQFHGKTVVVKYGGAAMVDKALRQEFFRDLVLLATVGIHPVVVHGGGPMINAMMDRLGKTPEFIDGHRVTDADTVEITEMVLCGTVNGQIVDGIMAVGGKAVGISGKDAGLLRAQKRELPADENDDVIDLGYVGEVACVEPQVLEVLEEGGFIPVISPLARCPQDNKTYNINADTVAGELARALRAEKLVLLSDQDGILRDKEDPATIITGMTLDEIDDYIDKGIIAGGMIPKVRACQSAVSASGGKAHIINGKLPHSLLLELFTDGGVGTQIIPASRGTS